MQRLAPARGQNSKGWVLAPKICLYCIEGSFHVARGQPIQKYIGWCTMSTRIFDFHSPCSESKKTRIGCCWWHWRSNTALLLAEKCEAYVLVLSSSP